ncbi:uncharacterized protein LOC129727452 [Wyeomyia smithii]|uniref:uncharacterized protein LOC129727452 n=1 Tax=Wyeomyia smithii TaxID=174621 RepID=UPI002467BA54|nr:uncharacterized protein LOC129727452 [Wyeomyia smithii]
MLGVLPRVLKKRQRVYRRKFKEPQLETTVLPGHSKCISVNLLVNNAAYDRETRSPSNYHSSDEFMDVDYLDEAFEDIECQVLNMIIENKLSVDPDRTPSVQLAAELSAWASKYSVPLAGVSDLLKILKQSAGLYLPNDARTLLKIPRKSNLRKICNGEYIHMGVAEFLRRFNLIDYIEEGHPVILSISVDGTPVSKSGANDLWIISGAVHTEEFKRHVFIVGIFNGPSKPTSFNTFLEEFVDEINGLLSTGFHKDDRVYPVKLKYFTADAPAVAYIKSIKSHGGYSACPKCETRGTNIPGSRKIVYPEVDAPVRTDMKFRRRISKNNQDCHHLSTEHTILENLPIDMIKDFVIDKMHAVDEGVCGKILIAFTGKANPQKLTKDKINKIDDRIKECTKFFPMEFQRKLRTPNYISKMKATEFRSFLLYAGPVLFHQIIPMNTYLHFLRFSIAIRILCSQFLNLKYNKTAKAMLTSFVVTYPELYGLDTVSYNVHVLLHLADDAYLHGPLDSYSCYPFEANIKKIKRYLHAQNKLLQQIFNRLQEELNSVAVTKAANNTLKLSHFVYNLDRFYRLTYPNFTIRADSISDNCIMWNAPDGIVILRVIFFEKKDESIYVTGQQLEVKESLCSSKWTLKLNMLIG